MCSSEDFDPIEAQEMQEYQERLARQIVQSTTIGVVSAAAIGLTYDQFKRRQHLLNIKSNH